MGNIVISEKERIRIIKQYQSDSFIKQHYDQIASIYAFAIPAYRIVNNKLETVYSDEVNAIINRLQELFKHYISSNYSRLFESVSHKKDICENVIHHTCMYFSLYTGCKNCTVHEFESKY